MDTHVAMPLLETVVFPYVMKVIPSDNNSPLHLEFLDNSGQDTTSDGYITGERAFLVDVCAFDRLAWSLESKTDITAVSCGFADLVV